VLSGFVIIQCQLVPFSFSLRCFMNLFHVHLGDKCRLFLFTHWRFYIVLQVVSLWNFPGCLIQVCSNRLNIHDACTKPVKHVHLDFHQVYIHTNICFWVVCKINTHTFYYSIPEMKTKTMIRILLYNSTEMSMGTHL